MVKSIYRKIIDTCNSDHVDQFSKLWRVKIVPSALFCGWRVITNGVVIEEYNKKGNRFNKWRVLCGEKEKILSHLFFTSKVVAKVWIMCDRWVGITNVHHNKTN